MIKEIYDGMNPGTGEVTIRSSGNSGENGPKKLVIGASGSNIQPKITQEEFDQLKAAVIALRTKIVEG